MSTKCKNCIGDGIVGAGDKPWLKEGALHTCEVCKGTGEIGEVEASEPSIAEENALVESLQEQGPVDNSTNPASFSNGSLDESSASPVESEISAGASVGTVPESPSELVAPESEQAPS